MRKYKGKYPTRIASVSGFANSGTVLVETNEGHKFLLHARDTNGHMPTLGQDVYALPFQRPHAIAFVQRGVQFARVMEDNSLSPFVEYAGSLMPPQTKLEDLERLTRKQFIADMVHQNILPRFEE